MPSIKISNAIDQSQWAALGFRDSLTNGSGRIVGKLSFLGSALSSLPKTLVTSANASISVDSNKKLNVTIGGVTWVAPVAMADPFIQSADTIEIYLEVGGLLPSVARARVLGTYKSALDLAGAVSVPPSQAVVLADPAPSISAGVTFARTNLPSWGTSFLPSSAGSVLWGDYRADVGCAGSSWGDSGGSARAYVQATGTKQPALSLSSSNFRQNPSLTFDGVDDFMSCTSNITGASYSYAAVVRLKANASYPMMWVNLSISKEVRWDPSGKPQTWTSVVLPTWATTQTNQNVIVCGGYDAAGAFVSVNGGTRVTTAGVSPSTAAGSSFIGSRDGAAYFANMEIVRLMMFSNYMGTTYETNLVSYLAGIYQ